MTLGLRVAPYHEGRGQRARKGCSPKMPGKIKDLIVTWVPWKAVPWSLFGLFCFPWWWLWQDRALPFIILAFVRSRGMSPEPGSHFIMTMIPRLIMTDLSCIWTDIHGMLSFRSLGERVMLHSLSSESRRIKRIGIVAFQALFESDRHHDGNRKSRISSSSITKEATSNLNVHNREKVSRLLPKTKGMSLPDIQIRKYQIHGDFRWSHEAPCASPQA